eukprot:SAG11_NODE_4029_length_2098_cov_3.906953_2_plen_249_part_00
MTTMPLSLTTTPRTPSVADAPPTPHPASPATPVGGARVPAAPQVVARRAPVLGALPDADVLAELSELGLRRRHLCQRHRHRGSSCPPHACAPPLALAAPCASAPLPLPRCCCGAHSPPPCCTRAPHAAAPGPAAAVASAAFLSHRALPALAQVPADTLDPATCYYLFTDGSKLDGILPPRPVRPRWMGKAAGAGGAGWALFTDAAGASAPLLPRALPHREHRGVGCSRHGAGGCARCGRAAARSASDR